MICFYWWSSYFSKKISFWENFQFFWENDNIFSAFFPVHTVNTHACLISDALWPMHSVWTGEAFILKNTSPTDLKSCFSEWFTELRPTLRTSNYETQCDKHIFPWVFPKNYYDLYRLIITSLDHPRVMSDIHNIIRILTLCWLS